MADSLRSRVSLASAKSNNVNQSSRLNIGVGMGENDEVILQGLAEDDNNNNRTKTFSRMIVENVFQKFNWYFPKLTLNDRDAPPSLSKAWAYYEHVTLPRHFIDETAADTVLRRAEPGEHERETELYSPFFTPQASLIEWGTGIDLYFISLRFFACVMLFAGCISIANMSFYDGDGYNRNDLNSTDRSELHSFIWRYSAVCTSQVWVMCSNCNTTDWTHDPHRYATGPNGTLVLRNFCPGGNYGNGIPSYAVLIFLLTTVAVFSYYLRLREIRFDEDKVTTTDYSVVVTNPPPDAIDPDEWRDFFEQFASGAGDQVTVVTVALNNQELFRRLMNRRIFRNQLRLKLPRDVDLDDKDQVKKAVRAFMIEKAERELGCIGQILEGCLFPVLRIFNMFLDPDVLMNKIETLTEEIKELQKEKYDATKVYVTFETEGGQRTALSALTAGKFFSFTNNSSTLAPSAVFQDTVLVLEEPEEPNAIRWLDLAASTPKRMFWRLLTLFLTCLVITFAGFIIAKARRWLGPSLSGPLTSVFNFIIPNLVKILMIFEPHSTEGSFQASLYLKITLGRWVLSAILSQAITPFTSTLSSNSTDLIPSIYGVLVSEVWISPVLRVIDIMGNLRKHILGPRARTQEEMNLNFQGTPYNLGERYTDFTKVLFLVFFYAALFPAGYFFGFVILTIQYVVDKYCLMRIWGWAPTIGSQLAVFSRRYFFTASMLALTLVSAYAFAQFPYDNLCVEQGGNETQFTIIPVEGVYDSSDPPELVNDGTGIAEVQVLDDGSEYEFCSQSWRDYVGFPSPTTQRIQTDDPRWIARVDENDKTWMTDEQEKISGIYGWTSVIFGFIVCAGFFVRIVYGSIKSIFVGTYEPEGASQHIDFSSNPEIFAYIPQIKRNGFPFPFLACDIDDIDQGLIGWNDQSRSYDYHNLIFDIPYEGLRRTSIIKENTRNNATIAEHKAYHDESGVEVSGSGVEVQSKPSKPSSRPIYSIIKHYPPKWQVELSKKNQ